MEKIQPTFHGSDLEVIADRYHIDVNSIVPYASNVNPLGISPLARQAILDNVDVIKSYPDRNYTSLKEQISKYCGTIPEHVVLGNGTSDLIRLTFELIAPDKTMIVGPTYAEYAKTASRYGSEVKTYMLKNIDDFEMDVDLFLRALNETYDLLVLCNPNNPTGKCLTKDQIAQILTRCRELDIFVMIDETYVEFVKDIDEISSVPLTITYNNLVILRGVSKFFAAPGLRLGYAITSNHDYINASDGKSLLWSINSYASVAGVMFEDEHYINATRTLIQTERNLIYSVLSSRKTIKVFRPTSNFVLIKLLKEEQTASEVFDYCIRRNLMIRDCTDYEGLGEKYIRFCFLKPEQDDDIVNTLLEIV